MRTANTFDFRYVANRQSIGVGGDKAQDAVVGGEQHTGQERPRVVVRCCAHDLIQSGDEIGCRDRRQWADDRARPLSKTGLARTRSAAAGLRRIIEPPTRVWSSQLLRARQTAVILQKVAGWPHADLCDELGPSKSAAALLARIERLA